MRLIITACLLLCAFSAQAQLVDLSVTVLKDGVPVENAILDVDGISQIPTNRYGSAQLQFPPGADITISILPPSEYETTTLDNLTWAQLNRDTVADENLQIIVAVSEGRQPQIDVESSHSGATSSGGGEVMEVADPGFLEGVVTSAESGDPIAGARVFLSGVRTDIRTDDEGKYRAEVPAGTYSLSVLAQTYSTQTLYDVQVGTAETETRNIELSPAGLELPEFVVLEPYIEGSLASLVEEQRSSAAVTDVLGAEQISRAGDSDAASALKRVTGLTLVDGKFIYVRGLGERFSSTLLNGAVVPSPDPTRRVVPLNLFPTDILEGIVVQKGFSPEMPGEFGGGTVQLRTKGIPESFFLKLGGSMNYVDGTTGSDGLRYRGGSDDGLGFDDGTRELPQLIQEALGDGTFLRRENPFIPGVGFSDEEIEAFGESFNNTYDIRQSKIQPDFGASAAVGNRWTFGETNLGILGAIRYDQSWDTRDEKRVQYRIAGDNELTIFKEFDVDSTSRNIESSGFLNVGIEKGDTFSVLATTVYTRLTEDEARITDGFDGNVFSRFYRLDWTENELFSQQVQGSHVIPEVWNLGIDWQFTHARANMDEPDYREYRYDDVNEDGDYAFSQLADSNIRRFSTLEDENNVRRVDLNLPLEWSQGNALTITAGAMLLDKNRESSIRRFKFNGQGPDSRNPDIVGQPSLEDILNPDYIGPSGFQLIETTRATDNYFAEQRVAGTYFNLDATILDTLRINAGLREERNELETTTFSLSSPTAPPVVSSIDESHSLPAASMTWFIGERHQLRASFAETVSRPEFREVSPAPYTDPILDEEVVGNPDLVTTDITNYDLRWETYFSPTENFSIALFMKEFVNPIELIRLPGSGILSLKNAETAENIGVEVAAYKNLGFIHDWFESMYVSGNISWIDSEITLRDEDAAALTSQVRPLQGQSPYVFNMQVGYDNPNRDIEATLLFNMFGERISEVGSLGAPDVYEEPFPQLDFVYKHGFGAGFKLKVKLKNLLDPQVEFSQGPELTRRYHKGREVSIGLEWELN